MNRLSRFLALGVALLCASGCLKPVKTQEDANTITVWEQEDTTVAAFIESVFSEFKKLPGNENLKIIRVHYQNEDLRQQFQTASIAGTPPDLIMCPSDFGGVFAVAGFILPVDGIFDINAYNSAVMEAVKLDGRYWGIPISNGNHLMLMYNKKLAKTPPETTDELFKFCGGEAKRQNLQYCLAFDMGEPFWMMPWLGSYGGWPIENRTPTLDTKPMRDTVGLYLDLKFKSKYVPPECDYNCMDALFKESKVAFIINGDWAIPTYSAHFKSDFGVGRIPKNSATGIWPSPMVSGKYFMLSSALKGAKLELLKKLVLFYTNKDNQIAQVKALKRLPSLKAANDAEAVVSDPILKASMSQILAGKPMPMATEMRAIWDSIRPYLGRIMTQKMGAEEGIRKMQLDALSKAKETDR